MKNLFITNYVGLASRLETLPLAFMLKDYYAYEINLDWPDLTDFNVVGSKRKKFRLHHRLNLKKILSLNVPEDLSNLRKHKNLNLRSQFGVPDYLISKYYLPTYQRIKLNPVYIYQLHDFFLKHSESSVVGVHIRRGDFILEKGDSYDATEQESVSVPTWWYVYVMSKIVELNSSVKFFISYTGHESAYKEIFDKFDCITFRTHQKHSDDYFGHFSEGHAVCDLFALACCNVIIASPCSSFSHVAVNALGNKSIAILPRNKMSKNRPEYGSLSIWGKQSRNLWYDSCRSNENWQRIHSLNDIPSLKPADCKWF